MKPIMLAKDAGSGHDGCPASTSKTATSSSRAPRSAQAELADLANVLPGETAVRINIDVVREALASTTPARPRWGDGMGRYLKRGSPEYTGLFERISRDAFRLETRQHYAGDEETGPLRQFLAGGDRPHDPGRDKWAARVRAAVVTGKVMQRVHIVTEPLSDYVRYELEWTYTPEAGEDIRIIPDRLPVTGRKACHAATTGCSTRHGCSTCTTTIKGG